jgi:pimeloyl-ACP methyl ester carboxylesterase
MTIETITVQAPDGRALAVDHGGDLSGRPIITCHGTPSGRQLFGPMAADAEAAGIHLIGYDRPGYGGSTPQPGRTVADCAVDVRAIAEAFSADRIAVWGISGGGPHALACAALLPDLVCAVASLASIAPYGPPDLDYFTDMGQDNVDDITLQLADPEASRRKLVQDRTEFLEANPDNFMDGFASLVSPADAAVLTGDLAAYMFDAMYDALTPGDEGWWEDGEAHLSGWGFGFESITVPVQLWQGRQDKFVPFQHGVWLADQIPGVEAHLTDQDGHLTLLARMPEIHQWLVSRF